MRLSEVGRDMIWRHEGVRNKLYDDRTGKTIAKASDAKGFPTIGVGHLVKKGENFDGKTLSTSEIQELFDEDIKYFEGLIQGIGPLKQGEFDSLVSFVYNVGPGKKGVKDGLFELRSGGESSILRNVKAGDMEAAARGFSSWTRSGGVQLQGLVNRRKDEARHFLTFR